MMNGGSPLRTIVRGIPGIAPAAATLFGIRIGRAVILRISLLLFARSLLSLVAVPLDTTILSYVWGFLFASIQTSVALAGIAAYLDLRGPLRNLGTRLFSPSDAPFVSIYANLVLISGPVLAILETVLAVFHVMRIARLLESRMHSAQSPRSISAWRNALLIFALLIYGVSATLFWYTHSILSRVNSVIATKYLLPFAIFISSSFFIIAFCSEQANILDAAGLTSYVSSLCACGAIELSGAIIEPEARAVTLLWSITCQLAALSGIPRFIDTVLRGADAVARDASTASGEGDNETNGYVTALTTAVAVLGVTFRLLVWTAQVRKGEYLPLSTRAVQCIGALVVFAIFIRVERVDEEEQVAAKEEARRREEARNPFKMD